MPVSANELKPFVLDQIDEIHRFFTLTDDGKKRFKVVDFGAGYGEYGKLIREALPHCLLYAVEVWKPYTKHENYKNYDVPFINNIVEVIDHIEGNIALFCDVLEHMDKFEAMKIVEKAIEKFNVVIITAPIGFMSQNWENLPYKNPYEQHVCGLNPHDFNCFPDVSIFSQEIPSANVFMTIIKRTK